ncbi:MAG: Outer membrane protein B [Pseudomonas fluorescens]|nr:MAG: Outer membrane protein B [Pseudomonas fluorescens]
MKYSAMQKTVLAMMVSVAATQASAVDSDVGTGQNSWVNQTLTQPLTLTGTRALAGPQPRGYAVLFSNTNVQGDLVNRADLNLSTQTAGNANGWGIDGSSGNGGGGPAGTITGNVEQAGTITANGYANTEGFEIGPATITGSVINSGKIIITPPANGQSSSEGVYLHGTQIGGDFSNTGLIDVTGTENTGLALDHEFNKVLTIGGKLLNSGTIRTTGDESVAVDIEAPTSALRIENSGLISANGNQAMGVQVFEGTIDSLLNTGTIEAKGADTNAINLSGATFTTNLASGARGIINRGTISAGGTAIQVDPSQQVSTFEINQQAGEIRSDSGVAIDAANRASLNWTGGKITGDVLGVTAVNVAGNADFAGNHIGGPVSVNAGSLNLSNPGTAINGNLNVASGAGIDLQLSNEVVPTTPYLNVNGTATFAQASNVTLSAKPADFSPTANGTEYNLVHATTLQNNGLAVTSNSGLLNVQSYSTDAQTIKAVVSAKSDQQVQNSLNAAGASGSSVRAVNLLKNNLLVQLNQNDPVFKAALNTNAQQLAQLGDQLAPDVNRGALDIALSGQTVVNGALLNRLASQRDNREAAGVWVQGLSSDSDQGGRGGNNGYSSNSSGVAVGADGRLNDTTTLGVAYSYLNSNIQSDRGNKTEVQGNALSLYGNWSLQNWFADGSLSYGHNDNDSRRHVAGSTAKGSYGSDALSASVLGGYSFKLSDAVMLEPRLAARYASVRMDGYSEKDSSAALHTDSQHYEVGEVGAGLRLAGNFPLTTGRLQPEATLMAYHDLIGDRVAQTSNFVLGGSAFTTTGQDVARDSYEASVGVNYQVSALTLGASYNRQARSGFDADGVMLKARYELW